MPAPVLFDSYADKYDKALNQGLLVTGEGKDYFAQGRIYWLASCLSRLGGRPGCVMDYGCGDGSSAQLLLEATGAGSLIGVDTSERSLDVANRTSNNGRTVFLAIEKYQPAAKVDLVYCNGVFHHIPLGARASAVNYIWRALRPGGIFSLWENNSWNPGTRYVMSRIPFDRDAVTLTPREAATLLQTGGFEILRRDSLFFFPKQLKWLRWIEPHLSRVPLGGQYQVLCRKPENNGSATGSLSWTKL